jgi:hypothetical protein
VAKSKNNSKAEVALTNAPLPEPGWGERSRRWARAMHVAAHYERWYPLGWALVAGALSCCWPLDRNQVDRLISIVLPVAISVAAILAGFQTTAQSVMLALMDSPSARFLRRTGHYDTLVGFHWVAIASLLVFIAVALAILAAKAIGDGVNQHGRLIPGVLVCLFILATAASFRVMRLMFKLLKTKEPASDSAGSGQGTS